VGLVQRSLPSAPTIESDYQYTGFDLTQARTIDSAGNQLSLTKYNYGTSASATSGLPNHGPVNAGGPYLSSVDRWVNTDGSLLTTSFASDDAGTILSSTDPNGKTTFGYDASDAYRTSTSLPTPSSGGSFIHFARR